MIKELYKFDADRCFEGTKEGKKIYFRVCEPHSKTYSLEEIEKALNEAELPTLCKEEGYKFVDFTREPLGNMFYLSIYEDESILRPMSYTLYDFDKIIKKNKSSNASLECVAIHSEKENNCYRMELMSYDEETNLCKDNLHHIFNYLLKNTKLIEKILGVEYGYIDEYYDIDYTDDNDKY